MHKQKVISLSVLFALFLCVGCSQEPASNTESLASAFSKEESLQHSYSEALTDKSENREVDFNFDADLDNWIGQYEYVEGAPEEINGIYTLDIHKSVRYSGLSRGVYYAEFSASGRMLDLGTIAIIQGNEDEISVVFYDYLPDGKGVVWSQFERGDILFTLKKESQQVIVEWNELDMADKNNTFTKVVENT